MRAGFNKIASAAVLRVDSGGQGRQSYKAAGRSQVIDNRGLGEARSHWNLVGFFVVFLFGEGQVEMAGCAGGFGYG